MTTNLETIPQVLRAAADYIDVHGWNQGSYINEDGGVCAAGAIYTVMSCMDLDSIPLLASKTVLALARCVNPTARFLLSPWNDMPGRTKEEVVQAMRNCADANEARP